MGDCKELALLPPLALALFPLLLLHHTMERHGEESKIRVGHGSIFTSSCDGDICVAANIYFAHPESLKHNFSKGHR